MVCSPALVTMVFIHRCVEEVSFALDLSRTPLVWCGGPHLIQKFCDIETLYHMLMFMTVMAATKL